MSRTDHPTINAAAMADPFSGCSRIVQSFARQLQPPTADEGFARIFRLTNSESIEAALLALGCISRTANSDKHIQGLICDVL